MNMKTRNSPSIRQTTLSTRTTVAQSSDVPLSLSLQVFAFALGTLAAVAIAQTARADQNVSTSSQDTVSIAAATSTTANAINLSLQESSGVPQLAKSLATQSDQVSFQGVAFSKMSPEASRALIDSVRSALPFNLKCSVSNVTGGNTMSTPSLPVVTQSRHTIMSGAITAYLRSDLASGSRNLGAGPQLIISSLTPVSQESLERELPSYGRISLVTLSSDRQAVEKIDVREYKSGMVNSGDLIEPNLNPGWALELASSCGGTGK